MFFPAFGETAFVELKSSGGSVSLSGLYLLNERGESYSLPEGVPDLASDQFLLIYFDGASTVEGNTIHADAAGFLDPEAGFVELYAADGALLDRAAWGIDQPAAVRLSRGGVIAELEPGTTIGRFPLSVRLDNLEWTIFAPAQATPSAANPQPGVEVMIPLNGAVIRQSNFGLSWYPVPGATQYRAQVASDEAFSALVVDETVDTPEVAVELQAGTYFWRVQAMAADGLAADFSPAQKLTMDSGTSSLHAAAPAAQASLGVPLISQHKDTEMLLLETWNEEGDHAWDVDHVRLDPNDPADNMNCALASVAMINEFFGGDLSQDRIGFEILKETLPGPERDLMYGRGTYDSEITEALNFALEAEVVRRPQPESLDVFWEDVQFAIDGGSPILATKPAHAFVITGYSEVDGERYVTINDPWWAEWGPYEVGIADMVWEVYWMISPNAVPEMNDPEIGMDSDGDGMVDFDETERFETDPNDEDTDKDDLNDKEDLRYSIYDEYWGYAWSSLPWFGRDYDVDGIPNELDEDSDGGGCFDGMEDINQDGIFELPETYNFNELDDACFWGSYELVLEEAATFDDGSVTRQQLRSFVKFSLTAEEDGTLEGLAQVTYSHNGQSSSDECGTMRLAGAEELSWQLELSGTFQQLEDESILVSFQATPDRGPAFSTQWTGGPCEQFSEIERDEGWSWYGLGGTLLDGVYDYSQEYPSAMGGTVREEIHMEQGEGL